MKGETLRKRFGSKKKPRKYYRFLRKMRKAQAERGEFAVVTVKKIPMK